MPNLRPILEKTLGSSLWAAGESSQIVAPSHGTFIRGTGTSLHYRLANLRPPI